MITNELRYYVSQNLAKGYTPEALRQTLLSSGWQNDDINGVFAEFGVLFSDQKNQPENPFSEDTKSSQHASQAGSLHIGMNVSASIDDPRVREHLSNPIQRPLQSINRDKPSLAKKTAKKVLFAGLVIFVILACVGAIVYAYQKYYALTPEEDIAIAFANLRKIHSVEYNGSINASVKIVSEESNKSWRAMNQQNDFKLSYDGASQVSHPDDMATLSSRLALSLNLDSSQLDNQEGKSHIELSAQMRYMENVLYLLIDQMPTIPFLDLRSYENKWIAIDMKGLEPNSSSTIATTLPLFGGFAAFSEKSAGTSSAPFPALTDLFSVVSKTRMTIDAVDVNHYTLKLKTEQLRNYLGNKLKNYPDIKKISMGISDKEIIGILENVTGEISIAKDDHLPMRIAFSLPIATSTQGVSVDAKISANVNLSHFNKPVTVSPPNEFIPLKDVLGQFFTQTNDGRTITPDRKRISDLANIQLANELYHDANNTYAPSLSALFQKKFLPVVPHDPVDNSDYAYAALNNGKDYVIGVSLDNGASPLLISDADVTTPIHGGDDAGCNGEILRHCYDVSSIKKS